VLPQTPSTHGFTSDGLISRRYSMREEREQDELSNLLTTIFYELRKTKNLDGNCGRPV
jgi:hypothetical protein